MSNPAAEHFQNLRNAWNQDASSHAVEVHAANLAASLAERLARHQAVTLCTAKPGTARALVGINHFLDAYGLRLIYIPNEDGRTTRVRIIRHAPVYAWHDYDPLAIVRERAA